jgi:hypothetical protein
MFSGYHVFFGWKMLKNTWQSSHDFWIKNSKKCLAIAKHFLDGKC